MVCNFPWYYDIQDCIAELQDMSNATTFIVSTSETSPNNLHLPITITGLVAEHTITVKKNANKMFVCQVFYHRNGTNWWTTTFAFCHEHMLDVR